MFVSRIFSYISLLCRSVAMLVFSATAFVACISPSPAQADEITVFAAASLKEALDSAVLEYEIQTGHKVSRSYAGSSVLARQISLGAPADVFISANADWMDVLEDNGQIIPDTRVEFLSNTLVLVAPNGETPLTPNELSNLAGYLGGRRLAMGLVEAVPAGIYGKAALETLGQWEAVAPLVAQTDNVRAALALVALRQTPLGIVYESDAKAELRVQVEMAFPADSHPAIQYPAAAVAGDNADTARDFLIWLQQDAAIAIFEHHGFITLDGS